jgi:hypothetical protein
VAKIYRKKEGSDGKDFIVCKIADEWKVACWCANRKMRHGGVVLTPGGWELRFKVWKGWFGKWGVLVIEPGADRHYMMEAADLNREFKYVRDMEEAA